MRGLYDNRMSLEFTAKPENEAFARVAVAAFVSQLNPTIDEISDIKTAVSEAVTNSIIHGYSSEEENVKLNARIFSDTIEIEVIDCGRGIENIEEAMKPLYTSKPNLERSGMGFTIMESFMDEIKVESSIGLGTRVFMKKRILKEKNEKEKNTVRENNEFKGVVNG